MSTYANVFGYLLAGWAAGFTSACVFHFAIVSISAKFVEYWSGPTAD